MEKQYPGFPYPAKKIVKYFHNLNFFMLQLDNGELMSFTADDKEDFLNWLQENRVPNLRDTEH
jgi:hypothetical protein